MDRSTIHRTSLQRALELAHGQTIDRVVAEALRGGGSRSAAARRLSITRTTLLLWIAQLGIDADKEIARGVLEAA